MTMPQDFLTSYKNCTVAEASRSSIVLDDIATKLSTDHSLRISFGSLDIWKHLRKLWKDLVRAQLTFWDDDAEDEQSRQESLRSMCTALARFTRNLVAGVPDNQQRSFQNEPEIRRLLHYYTSWTAAEDKDTVLVARILTQTLSNIVTGNDILMDKLWELYMNLPEDQVVLIRLLSLLDHRTLLSVLVLIRNCLQGSKSRAKLFTRSTIGARICVSLLDDMVILYDAEDSTDGARAFDVAYEIFSHVMQEGLVPDLYTKLAIPDEVVTPHQTTLLKLVDSYLQSSSTAKSGKKNKAWEKLDTLFAACFFSLSSYAQQSIRRSIGNSSPFLSPPLTPDSSSPTGPLSELDVMLPKVCEALVLVTQCMITVTLIPQSREASSGAGTPPQSPKCYFNTIRKDNRGLVESLIELLRLLDLFLPRINFGRPVTSKTPEQTPPKTENPGFSYLKRDLVRLLGILCHEVQAIQDRVRECGGIEVVMNLCVVDERNPYLREHAIFTLRNLLKGNTENQAIVNEVKPTGFWDENGVLRDLPGAVRK